MTRSTGTSCVQPVYDSRATGVLAADAFDVAIFDEAHRTVGNKNNRNSRLLFDENIKINLKLC